MPHPATTLAVPVPPHADGGQRRARSSSEVWIAHLVRRHVIHAAPRRDSAASSPVTNA